MQTPVSSGLYILSFEVWTIFAHAVHSYTSGFYATHALHGYSSRNTTHTVLQKLKYQPWNITAQQNTVGHKQKVSNETNLHLKDERSSTISQLNQGWFSKELRPEIKSTYQGLKRTAQTKRLGWPYPCKWCWVTSVALLLQGNANVDSVEPPLAPQK
jgi:hypothetical protein